MSHRDDAGDCEAIEAPAGSLRLDRACCSRASASVRAVSDEIHADDRVSRGQRGHQWIPRTGRPREAVYEKDRGPALLCALEGGVQGGGYASALARSIGCICPSISHGDRRVWRKTDTIVDLSIGGVETAGLPDVAHSEASSSIRRSSCHDLRSPLYTLDTGGHGLCHGVPQNLSTRWSKCVRRGRRRRRCRRSRTGRRRPFRSVAIRDRPA